jgi:hypothetical protein
VTETRWPGHRLVLALAGIVLVTAVAVMAIAMHAAALPPQASGPMLAVFVSSSSDDLVFAALVRAGGRPMRKTWVPGVWVVAGDKPGFVARLRAEGALAAYREMPFSPQIAGCFAYVDQKTTKLFEVRP